MNPEDINRLSGKAYGQVKEFSSANAEMIGIDSGTIEIIQRMCDESVIVAASMWKNLADCEGDKDKLMKGMSKDSSDNAESTLKHSSDFMSAIRTLADRMGDLNLKRNEAYLNAVGDRYAAAYKRNYKSASYLVMWAISIIHTILDNAAEMRDDVIPMAERTIKIMEDSNTDDLDHMKEWRRQEGLEGEE